MNSLLRTVAFSGGLLLAGSAFAQTGLISFNFASFGSSALNFDGQHHLGFSPDTTTGHNHDFQIASDALGVASGLGGLYGDISDPTTSGGGPSQYTIVEPITTVAGVSTAALGGGKGTFSIYDNSGTALTAKVWWVNVLQVGTVGVFNSDGTLNLSNFSYAGADPALQALATAATGTSVVSFQFAAPVSLSQLANSPHSTNFSASFSAIPEPSTYAVFLGGAVFACAAFRRRFLRQGSGSAV